MIPLTPEIWRRVEPLLDRALELDATARAAFLESACAGEPQLRAAVEALLRADGEAGEFLETPAAVRAGELLRAGEAPLDADPTHAADAGARDGERIGPFRIVRELAAGGMGVVYLAERADGQFEQCVALKVIRRSLFGEEMRRRFLRERQILAHLQHASIAYLLDGGVTADGRPWYAMEHVEGVPLTRYCDTNDLGLEQRLRLFGRVCAAVEYAHAHHVVHRDLKPANILVTGNGELKLIDFGIARMLDGHTEATAAHEMEERAHARTACAITTAASALTPEYAAPEQIRSETVTSAADVYALGVVLHELLCGRRPRRATEHNAPVLERMSCTADAARPAAADRMMPAPLHHILCRAMQREPEARYPTVAALAAEIDQYLDDLPTIARRGTATGLRTLIGTRRRTVAAVAIGALLVATASASVVRRPDDSGRDAAVAPRDDVTSAVAQRLFEEGLRAYHQVDLHTARRFFRAALADDATFAAATYYAVTTERLLGMPPDSQLEARLRRLVTRLPERERLLVQGGIAWNTADPALLSIADTLLARYTDEPQTQLLAGRAFAAVGAPRRALRHLQRAVHIDSLGLRGISAECVACDAFAAMIPAYVALDSLAAAERTARDWARLRPAAGRAWHTLAMLMEWQGRVDEALAAIRRAAPLAPANPYVPIFPALLDIRTGDFASADRLLREQARAGPPDVQKEALWFLTISLRHQGRLRDALATARQLRRLHPEEPEPRIAEAQVLLEMGHARAAAALFDSLATLPARGDFESIPSLHGKLHSWRLVHLATALASAGDTAALLPLADTIETLGARTLGALYRNTHHHVRGLHLAAHARFAEAADRFRRAALQPTSPTSGFTRTNLELARMQITLDEPGEAVRTLRPALQRGLEAGGLYVTRTELQELLGYAFEAAGEPDSARVQYGHVLAAWQNADPELAARRNDLRRRLQKLNR
ncbi:MAG TPA: protein kinase [Longimicrobiales bacterium]|nr:protein kinase [Longimicrobiales bacterium]